MSLYSSSAPLVGEGEGLAVAQGSLGVEGVPDPLGEGLADGEPEGVAVGVGVATTGFSSIPPVIHA